MEQEPGTGPQQAGAESSPSQIRGLAQASLLYLEARGKLFQIEAQEAGSNIGRVIVRAVVAFGLLAGAWLLIVPAGIMFAAEKTGKDWQHMALIVAAVHLVAGLGLALHARSLFKRLHLFDESINQFQRDREWVTRQEKR
jgi:uncharacterized membrane protein YqjE